jgi:hypothetical protein
LRFVDRICAGSLFLLAIVNCLLVPRTYTGRIWIFGAGLALLFTAMLNVLRIRNVRGVKGLRLFCVTANVTALVFAIALMASIGKSRTLQHPQYRWWEPYCWPRRRSPRGKMRDSHSGVEQRSNVAVKGQEKCHHRRIRRRAEAFYNLGSHGRPRQRGLHRILCETFEGTAIFRYHCLRQSSRGRVLRVLDSRPRKSGSGLGCKGRM